jgi:hypothetical protein
VTAASGVFQRRFSAAFFSGVFPLPSAPLAFVLLLFNLCDAFESASESTARARLRRALCS